MKKLLVLVPALFATIGCSGSEQLCQDDIKSRLINPETAEFFEFEPIAKTDAEARFFEYALKARGIDPNEASRYLGTEDMKTVAERTISELEKDGAEFRSYRAKANSRLGLKVTSDHVCAVSSDQCACFSEETF